MGISRLNQNVYGRNLLLANLLYNEYRVFSGDKERPGRDADPSPTSSAVGYERVELYLYSPYGPYGLYRASVPVQGWPLPFLPIRQLTTRFKHSQVTVQTIRRSKNVILR
jgi:hypothetical protein